MKTKNNVQKTLLRWAAVFVSFILISFTVSAQDFWKRILENSSFGNIALAMVDTKDVPAESNYMAFTVESEQESNLELETWMINTNSFGVAIFDCSDEKELELVPETWMFNQNVFLPETVYEPALQLENWMVSETVWNM